GSSPARPRGCRRRRSTSPIRAGRARAPASARAPRSRSRAPSPRARRGSRGSTPPSPRSRSSAGLLRRRLPRRRVRLGQAALPAGAALHLGQPRLRERALVAGVVLVRVEQLREAALALDDPGGAVPPL